MYLFEKKDNIKTIKLLLEKGCKFDIVENYNYNNYGPEERYSTRYDIYPRY